MNNIYFKRFVEPSTDGQRIVHWDSNDYLLDESLIATKLTEDNLPESFIPCFRGDIGGFVCTAGIKAMSYEPSQYKTKINDISDDKLYISYRYKTVGTKNYDIVIFGNEILPVLFGAVEFSGINIDDILIQMFESDKMKTTEKYMRTWKILYSRLEPTISEKVMLTRRLSKRYPNKENADFDMYQISFNEYLNQHFNNEIDEPQLSRDVWRMVDAW